MTSRKNKTLAERQLQMLKRHRPQRLRRLTVAETERLRRRIAATVLLRKSWTPEQIAAHFKVNLPSVEAWINKRKPLL